MRGRDGKEGARQCPPVELFVAALAVLAIQVGAMIVWWGVSLATKDCGIADRWWGLGFLLGAVAAWQIAGTQGPRWFVVPLVALWGIRLSAHIFGRSQGQPEDRRYARMRAKHPDDWWWRSLTDVFLLQGLLMWIISAPVIAVLLVSGGPAFSVFDGIGVAVFAVGLVIEGVADAQLQWFRRNGGTGVYDRGLWRYSRHPNYFGETLVWWGLWFVALAHGAWWSFVGPLVLTVLLLRVSGVTLLEGDLRQRKDGYREYVRRTSAFIPWPPKR